MKRVSFLLSAAFAMALLDLISRVHLVSCYPNRWNIPHYPVVFEISQSVFEKVALRFSLRFFFFFFLFQHSFPISSIFQFQFAYQSCLQRFFLSQRHTHICISHSVNFICPVLKSPNTSRASLCTSSSNLHASRVPLIQSHLTLWFMQSAEKLSFAPVW